MEPKIKRQRGYLVIMSLVLIVIIAFIGITLSRMYLKTSHAEINVTRANQALFIAQSGLERAQHDIIMQHALCTDMTTTYTNTPIFQGTFTITATETHANGTLQNSITNASTIISLKPNAGINFAAQGVVQIGSEYIRYTKKSGDNLENITRGIANSPITDHANNTPVKQAQCHLESTGGVPNITAMRSAKRKVSKILFQSLGFHSSIVSSGDVTIGGAAGVHNLSVTKSSPNYAGSTIISSSTVTLTGNGSTFVGDTNIPPNSVLASNKNHADGDYIQNSPAFTPNDLFGKYFGTTIANFKTKVDPSIAASDLPNVAKVEGKIIWIDGDISYAGGSAIQIGSATKPIILVIDGNFKITGKQVDIYGILFVIDTKNINKGTIKFAGGADVNIYGAMAATGNIDIHGNKQVFFKLDNLPIWPGGYGEVSTGPQELF
jgi:Tfp pilus assembly protein PilX